jgi:hypothetical protein
MVPARVVALYPKKTLYDLEVELEVPNAGKCFFNCKNVLLEGDDELPQIGPPPNPEGPGSGGN